MGNGYPHAIKSILRTLALLLLLAATTRVSAGRIAANGRANASNNATGHSAAANLNTTARGKAQAAGRGINVPTKRAASAGIAATGRANASNNATDHSAAANLNTTDHGKAQAATFNIDINGKVTSTTGEAIAGVSVTVKGSSIGTATDNNGNFHLNVPSSGTLVFSSIGFDTKEVPISDSIMTVTLAPSNKALDQVVVVGYGTQRRSDLTGAIGTIKGAEVSGQQVLTATQAIQGKVSGVQVIGSGDPNANPAVHIRGVGTMLGGASPLFVVDGIITDDIRNINSADILSIDILKDASSTAIYGVRAANGVMLITTKKGKPGKPIVTYDGTVGTKEIAKLVNMAGPLQYANYVNEANIYYGSGDSLVTSAMLKAAGGNTDWFDAITKRSLIQNHNISLSGGSDKVDYFISAGYTTDGGIIKTNDFSRFTLRSNTDYKVTNNFKITTQINFSRASIRQVDLNNFNLAYRAAPDVPAKIGDLYGNTSLSNNVGNPLLNLDKVNNRTTDHRLQGTIIAEYKPIPWITLHTSLGIDLDFGNNRNYIFQYLNSGDADIFLQAGGNQYVNTSTLAVTKGNTSHWVWDNTATLNKSFDKHHLTLLVGTTAEEYNANSMTGTVLKVPSNPNLWYLSQGDPLTAIVTNTGDKYTRNSYLGRLNYNFDERYYLTASIRADASSHFPSSDRWGYFPSVALAWNMMHEDFLSPLKSVFDQLKLRGSWGEVGNDAIPSNAYLALATPNVPYIYNGTQYNGISFDSAVNPNLKWETSKEYDLGIDFALLHNRLNGTIDFYNKKTTNALTIVQFQGVYIGDVDNQYITNAASFRNKGVEVALNWTDNIDKDWKYSIGGNIAFNSNKVIGLNGGQALYDGNINGGFVTKTDNGHPIGSFYLRQADGVFQNATQIANSAQPGAQVGDLRYKDLSGPNGKPDGSIDDNYDRAFSGSYQPKYTYGVTGSVSYKTFDLSVNGYGTHGGKIYNGKKALTGSDQLDNIETKVAKGRWTINHPSNSIPRATLGVLPNSTYFLESGSFFRINNITLGYTLPHAVLTKAKFQNLRIYVTAQNPFMFTHYSGFTPELEPPLNTSNTPSTTNAGIEQAIYPTTRSLSCGIDFSF